jgi:hypothetical protein
MNKEYKVKRLRDGEVLTLNTSHALNLLRLDAKQQKREFELAEKNYNFSNNEIHRNADNRDSKKTEASK